MALISGKCSMVFFRSYTICIRRIMYLLKKTKVYFLSIDLYHCSPISVCMPIHSFKSARIVFSQFVILKILSMCCFTKIYPSVISRITRNMVNLVFRPLPGHDQPRKTVTKIHTATYANNDVSIAFTATSNIASFCPWWTVDFPIKMASQRLIVQYRAHKFCANIILRFCGSHSRWVYHAL